MSTAAGVTLVVGVVLVSALAYRHRGRGYARGKSEAIESPRSFRFVYRFIQASTLLAGVGSFVADHPLLLEVHRHSGLRWVGCGVALLALAAFVWAKRTLGAHYSPCFDAFVPRTLVQSGPYRHVRHPIYTANLVLLGGLFLATGSLWLAFDAGVLFVYYRGSAHEEERALGTSFPGYADYVRTTGRFLPRRLALRASWHAPAPQDRSR